MGVEHIAVDNILLGKGVVGARGPGAAVNRQGAIADVAHGVDQGGVIGIGIQHSETLDGSANISQTTQVRVAGNQLLSNEDELYIESASESTSIQIQLGYLLDYGSINLAADKLVDDDWRDALIELGITLYF